MGGGRTSLSKHTQSPPSPQVGSLHNAQHPPTYLCVVLSEFVPNVCQLMLNTGTPSVDIGEGQTYNRWQTKKMSLPCTPSHTLSKSPNMTTSTRIIESLACQRGIKICWRFWQIMQIANGSVIHILRGALLKS